MINPADFRNEVINLFIKIIIPAIVAIGIKVAIEMKHTRITIFSALSSLMIGVGCAFLSAGIISANVGEEAQPIVIGIVAIVGDKIAFWLIYKFNFDKIGAALSDLIVNFIKKK